MRIETPLDSQSSSMDMLAIRDELLCMKLKTVHGMDVLNVLVVPSSVARNQI